MISIPRPSFHFGAMAANEEANIYAYRGRYLLSKYQDKDQNQDVPKDLKLSDMIPHPRIPLGLPQLPVCIIGAGAAGLYTAMIFESLEIPYQIVEANTPARIGGRMFTYHFPYGAPYDYFVSKNLLHFTPSTDPRLGRWSHAVPRHAIYEADL